MVGTGKFAHRDDIAQNMLQADVAVVLRNVVGTGQDDDYLRIEVDDVLPHTYQHLTGRLSVDATPDKAVLGEELRPFLAPPLGDAIAQEHDADVRFHSAQTVVLRGIAVELRPVTRLFCMKHSGYQKEEYKDIYIFSHFLIWLFGCWLRRYRS